MRLGLGSKSGLCPSGPSPPGVNDSSGRREPARAQRPEEPPPRVGRGPKAGTAIGCRGSSLSLRKLPEPCRWIHGGGLPTAQHKRSAQSTVAFCFVLPFGSTSALERTGTGEVCFLYPALRSFSKSYNNSQDAFWARRRRPVLVAGETPPPCPSPPPARRGRLAGWTQKSPELAGSSAAIASLTRPTLHLQSVTLPRDECLA